MGDQDFTPAVGDTIAYALMLPVYGIGRVVAVKPDNWYSIRRFDVPGRLNDESEDLRLSTAIDLKPLLPVNNPDQLNVGDTVLADIGPGLRFGTLDEHIAGQTSVRLFGLGKADASGARSREKFFAAPNRLYTIASFLNAQ